MSTFHRLRKILSETLGTPELLITRESRLADLLPSSGDDSLALIELSMALEEELELSVPDSASDDLLQISERGTVGELADWIDAHRTQ